MQAIESARCARTRKGPDILIAMWCVDRGDGKSGFARFSIYNPKDKTPLTDEEVKQLLATNKGEKP